MTQPGESQERGNMLDRYELIAEIASGGMGVVYLARLEGVAGFQRLFAIKLMHPHLANDHQFVSMLLDEARIAARIHHPNAVEIIDVCASERGYYLVMPYVEGFTLDDILEHPELSATDRMRLGLRVVSDAALGLHSAHEIEDDDHRPLGLVHRDVSPQNILVGVDGSGRIADFGVARAAARITSSRPGMIKGKPCYMAPEQARGEADLDRRLDVFAMGIVLWEVLAGRQLFHSEAGEMAVLVQVINDPIVAPSVHNPDVTEALDRVCMRALERDRDARYQTAKELAIAIERAARDAGILASRHEIADDLRELFGERIAERRHAIKDHLSRGSVPQVGSDVFDVPKLHQVTPSGSNATSAPTRRSEPDAPATEREPSDEWHEEAVADTRLAHTNPPQPPARRRFSRIAIALIVIGAVLFATAFVVSMNGGPEADAETTSEPTDDVTAESSVVEGPSGAELAPPAEGAPDEAVVEQDVTATDDLPVTAEREATEDPAVEAAGAPTATEDDERDARRERRRARREALPTATGAMTDEAPAAGTQPSSPTFEGNPYLNR